MACVLGGGLNHTLHGYCGTIMATMWQCWGNCIVALGRLVWPHWRPHDYLWISEGEERHLDVGLFKSVSPQCCPPEPLDSREQFYPVPDSLYSVIVAYGCKLVFEIWDAEGGLDVEGVVHWGLLLCEYPDFVGLPVTHTVDQHCGAVSVVKPVLPVEQNLRRVTFVWAQCEAEPNASSGSMCVVPETSGSEQWSAPREQNVKLGVRTTEEDRDLSGGLGCPLQGTLDHCLAAPDPHALSEWGEIAVRVVVEKLDAGAIRSVEPGQSHGALGEWQALGPGGLPLGVCWSG